MSEITGIEQAIAIAGSQGELASWLGISRQAISRWHQKGEVPSDRADLVADLTGVPAWRLCPRFRRKPGAVQKRREKAGIEDSHKN